MAEFAIRVENLSKLYFIGNSQQQTDTLREAMACAFLRLTRRHGWDGSPITNPSESRNRMFWALKDVSFDVKQGEVIGIVGSNGAGKSTLLKVLSRITEPTSGSAEIRGRVASLLEVGTGFHPELTGRENVYLNGAILGMRHDEISRRFDEIVAFAEIEQFLDTPVKRYSSGMYVRLAFAVAAHLEPEILLVDEVLAVGDASFQKKCLGKVGDVASEGRTVLFVSHNMSAVMAICSHAILMSAGQVISSGRAHEVVQTYIGKFKTPLSQEDIRNRQDRGGDGSIRVVNLDFGIQSNPTLGYWITGQDCTVSIGYECAENRSFRNIEIAVGIRKLDETRLFYLGTKVVHQDVDRVYGLANSKCVIKRLPLEPGRYSSVVEIKQNGVIVDIVERAAMIDVVDGDFYGTGVIWPYGGFLCDYYWKHSTDGYN